MSENLKDPGQEDQEQEDRGFYKFEEKEFIIPEEKDRVSWTKANLVITCHNCGNVDTIATDIENGIRIDLFPNNYQEIRVPCTRCNSVMSMHFVKAEGAEEIPFEPGQEIEVAEQPSVEAETVNEDRIQNEETKDSRIVEHELKEESTEA